LRIVGTRLHPRYNKEGVNFEGREAAVPGYDVGLLLTEADAPTVLPIAGARELARVDSGYRIAYLGFPMEGMAGGGVDVRNPVATMQSGIVTSATDFWLGQAEYDNRLLIQHNLGATGGASGSPVFNADGEVVAVLSAGNVSGVLRTGSGDIARVPSGVLVNFAQRVDILKDIWPEYPR
jgi:S1-C subfamily serine protease